ncbi:PAS domain-containing protein [Ferrovibrio sp.]|uniref:PAS domain-containing protein n=1 Tax=Ferrovibrio sp. TaxID=1917215 RepID=UPI00311F16AF
MAVPAATVKPAPTGTERSFGEDEIIVSKTDARGRLFYANDVFCKVGLYSEQELAGQPHSIVRHPDMPRCVFQLLWETIAAGREIFAYVKNMAKNGDHYWVFAHVTPSYGRDGQIDGYHSSRRRPDRAALAQIEPLYRRLLEAENAAPDRKQGQAAGYALLHGILAERGQSYEEFVFSLDAGAGRSPRPGIAA